MSSDLAVPFNGHSVLLQISSLQYRVFTESLLDVDHGVLKRLFPLLFCLCLLPFSFQSLVVREQRKLLRLILRLRQMTFMDNVIGGNRYSSDRKIGIGNSLIKGQYGFDYVF